MTNPDFERLPVACGPGGSGNMPAQPPVGLRPRWLAAEQDQGMTPGHKAQHRVLEILEACYRYAMADKRIPDEWLDELRDTNQRLSL